MQTLTFKIMDQSGHSTLDFSKLDPAKLKGAAEKFDALRAEGHTAATRKAGEGDYHLVRNFKDVEDEVLFVPHMQGG